MEKITPLATEENLDLKRRYVLIACQAGIEAIEKYQAPLELRSYSILPLIDYRPHHDQTRQVDANDSPEQDTESTLSCISWPVQQQGVNLHV